MTAMNSISAVDTLSHSIIPRPETESASAIMNGECRATMGDWHRRREQAGIFTFCAIAKNRWHAVPDSRGTDPDTERSCCHGSLLLSHLERPAVFRSGGSGAAKRSCCVAGGDPDGARCRDHVGPGGLALLVTGSAARWKIDLPHRRFRQEAGSALAGHRRAVSSSRIELPALPARSEPSAQFRFAIRCRPQLCRAGSRTTSPSSAGDMLI